MTMRLSYSQDDDSMTMCLSNSQDDDSMTMCLSYSQEDDSMTMCLSYSQEDDSMTMCLSYSPDEESRKPERTVPSLQLPTVFSESFMLPKRRFWTAEPTFQKAFSKHFSRVILYLGNESLKKCVENTF